MKSIPARNIVAAAIAAAFLLSPMMAHADFLAEGQQRIEDIWDIMRSTIYVVAAIGLGILGIFAFFGRFKWGHFFALAGGVFLVAVADQLIEWLGGDASGL